MKSRKSSSVLLEFWDKKSAAMAKQILLRQLKNIGESRISAEAAGKMLKIEIADKNASRQKAGVHAAKRLGKMLDEIDREA